MELGFPVFPLPGRVFLSETSPVHWLPLEAVQLLQPGLETITERRLSIERGRRIKISKGNAE